jgi:hypothetical protein
VISFLFQACVSEALIERLVDQGVLTLHLSTSDAEVDDLETLTRALWQAVAEDFSCLTVINQLLDFADAARSCANLDPVIRASAVAACEKIALSLPGRDILPRAVVFEDVFSAESLGVQPGTWRPFLDDVALYGKPLRTQQENSPDGVLAEVYDGLFPGQAQAPFLEFHRRYLNFCAHHGFSSDPSLNAREVCASWGKTTRNSVDEIVADLKQALLGSSEEVSYWPALPSPDRDPVGQTERMSVRFTTAPLGPAGPRFQLLFWGADQMSLFPRYSQFPGSRAERLQATFAEWMTRWPEVVDIYSSFGRNVDLRPVLTKRIVETPGTALQSNTIRLRDLVVSRDEPGQRLILLDGDGQGIRPVFFGVSSPVRLPEIIRLLMFLSGRQASALEMTAKAVGRIVAATIAKRPARPLRLPAIYLGDHILLSPAAMVFDPKTLPCRADKCRRNTFFDVHDWLADHGIPPVGRVQNAHGSLWVDLQHPLGVESFLRFVRHCDAALIQPHQACNAELYQEARSREYYVELAAGVGSRCPTRGDAGSGARAARRGA